MQEEIAVGMAETAPDTIDGTVVGIVFRNDETGYSVLRVAGPDDGTFRLKHTECVVVGTCGAVWEGEVRWWCKESSLEENICKCA